MLLALKEYPRLSKRRAFYIWYLRTAKKGVKVLEKVANNFVLFTNINKTTAFYRMLKLSRLRTAFKTIMQAKRTHMARLIDILTRLIAMRTKIDFSMLKEFSEQIRQRQTEIN